MEDSESIFFSLFTSAIKWVQGIFQNPGDEDQSVKSNLTLTTKLWVPQVESLVHNELTIIAQSSELTNHEPLS
jgi:hypothetical protein